MKKKVFGLKFAFETKVHQFLHGSELEYTDFVVSLKIHHQLGEKNDTEKEIGN